MVKALTLNTLSELVKTPRLGGHATKYSFFSGSITEEQRNRSVEQSHWVLMTKDVLEEAETRATQSKKILSLK